MLRCGSSTQLFGRKRECSEGGGELLNSVALSGRLALRLELVAEVINSNETRVELDAGLLRLKALAGGPLDFPQLV